MENCTKKNCSLVVCESCSKKFCICSNLHYKFQLTPVSPTYFFCFRCSFTSGSLNFFSRPTFGES